MISRHRARLLGVFAKYWRPGTVKTRLAAEVGEEAAAEFHRASLECVLRRLSTELPCDGRQLWVAPSERVEEVSEWVRQLKLPAEWLVLAQTDGDLGTRMEAFFRAGLREYQSVVLLGSDSPNAPVEAVASAWAALESHPVAIAPCDDGGYWLLGASGGVPPIFSDLPFSSPQLLKATAQRLSQAGMHYECLERWYDVDEPEDLTRLTQELHRTWLRAGDPLQKLLDVCQRMRVSQLV